MLFYLFTFSLGQMNSIKQKKQKKTQKKFHKKLTWEYFLDCAWPRITNMSSYFGPRQLSPFSTNK